VVSANPNKLTLALSNAARGHCVHLGDFAQGRSSGLPGGSYEFSNRVVIVRRSNVETGNVCGPEIGGLTLDATGN
jgi:hypothetical protein